MIPQLIMDIPCMSKYSNKKVIGVNTKSLREHAVSQTRELACTQEVLPQVMQIQYLIINNCEQYITEDLGLINSLIHGTVALYVGVCSNVNI